MIDLPETIPLCIERSSLQIHQYFFRKFYLFQKMEDQNIKRFVVVPTTKGSINSRVKK